MLEGNVAPVCVCDHGFEGLACDSCVTHFIGTSCEMCEDGYIGYNTTCSVLCLHGYATKLGRSCTEENLIRLKHILDLYTHHFLGIKSCLIFTKNKHIMEYNFQSYQIFIVEIETLLVQLKEHYMLILIHNDFHVVIYLL